jgi:hypothetical protein
MNGLPPRRGEVPQHNDFCQRGDSFDTTYFGEIAKAG